ncbi:hypothetical protein [Nocardia altamirensis]|uniref:hypothetical protein n=1 Tax=Nocardia altamirensis TaxID=472158 RepID=UPI0008404E48|nr:hypothetical protein [Nocardia altamirensis]
MAKGFYNHYDDPDEFWDEEPLAPQSRSTPAPPPPVTPPPPPSPAPQQAPSAPESRFAAAGITPPSKPALVDVVVGLDRLPTSIKFGRSWQNTYEPPQYAKSIMDAYDYAVVELAARLIEARTLPPTTIPSLRDATPLLLRTRTYDEFRELYDHLYIEHPYTVHGPGYNAHGEPTLTVTATLSKLVAIKLDPNWAASIDPNYIAQDILDCCTQVRAKRPEVVRDVYLDQESTEELAGRVVEHERYLLRNES